MKPRKLRLVEPPAIAFERVSLDPIDAPSMRPHRNDPHADLVTMFRSAGPWDRLCAARKDPRGADREEALAYLLAWCAIRNGETATGWRAIAGLAAARSPAIATAVREDLLDSLARLPARHAIASLASHQIERTAGLDALAATYAALDRRADVLLVLAERNRYGDERRGDYCRRIVREYTLVTGPRRNFIRDALESLHADPTCERLAQHLTCPLALGTWTVLPAGNELVGIRADLAQCTTLLAREPALVPRAYLAAAFAHWPRSATHPDAWLAFVGVASRALGEPDADELLVAALENATLVSDCASQLPRIVVAARRLQEHVVGERVADRVDRLVRLTEVQCDQRRVAARIPQ